MGKLIGYARVSTRRQTTGRQESDLLAAGVRRDDLYIDRGVSGARASRPNLDVALDAIHAGDTLVITTLDRLGRSTENMLAFAYDVRARGAGLRVLNLGGGDVDTATPMGSMLFTIMAALAQMELEIKRERVLDSGSKRREADKSLAGDGSPSATARSEAPCGWWMVVSRLPRLLAILACHALRFTAAPAAYVADSRC